MIAWQIIGSSPRLSIDVNSQPKNRVLHRSTLVWGLPAPFSPFTIFDYSNVNRPGPRAGRTWSLNGKDRCHRPRLESRKQAAGWFTHFSEDAEPAFAVLLRAAVFSTSVALSRIESRCKTAIAASFVIFALAAFTALVVYQHNQMSPQLPYIVFLCSACFQAIVVSTMAVVAALDCSHTVSQHPPAAV